MEILSLPYFAVLRILQHMDDDELYIHGHLCRRLNLLAFEVFLKRKEVYTESFGGGHCLDLRLPRDSRIISVLCTGFFTPVPSPLRSIDCDFMDGPEDPAILINESCRKLLDLFTPGPTTFSRALNCIESMMLFIRPGLRVDVGKLFVAILSSCDSLRSISISHNLVGTWEYYTREPKVSTYRPGSRYGGDDLNYRRLLEGRRHSTPIKNFHRRTKGPQLILDSLILASLPYDPESISQTFKNFKTVRNLTLPHRPKLWGKAWSPILSHFASTASSLNQLTIDPVRIFPDDFMQFLSQLPKLSSLRVEVGFPTPEFYDPPNMPVLPRKVTLQSLSELDSSPGYASIILAQRLPRLQTITITAHGGNLFTLPSLKAFERLTPAIQARKRTEGIQLNVLFQYDDDKILSMADDLCGYFRTRLGHHSTLHYPFSVFTELNVDITPTEPSESYDAFLQIMTRWFLLFKGLNVVNFFGYCERSIRLPMYPVIRAIHTRNPSIGSIVCFLETYNVKQIIDEHEKIENNMHTGNRTISDLDQDIFSVVFQFLDTLELYPLASVCRNLRDWVLPIYLRRSGYPDPAVTTHIALMHGVRTLRDVSALVLSSMKTMGHVSIQIPSDANLFLIFQFLRRILRLIRQCSTIESVTLDLGGIPWNPNGPVAEQSRVVWTEMVFSVFCALVERCSSLTIQGHGVFGCLTFSHRDHHWSDRKCLPAEAVKFPLKHKLSSLEIDLDSLNLPVLRDFLTDGLWKSESVTKVVFRRLTSLVSSSFQAITSALPMITHLQLLGSDILPADILSAICLLPLLQDLQLVGCQWYVGAGGPDLNGLLVFPVAINGPVPELAHLRSLWTTNDYATFLCNNDRVLNVLENLTIQLLHYAPWQPTWAHPITVLRSVSDIVGRLKLRPTFTTLSLIARIQAITNLSSEEMTNADWEIVAQSTRRIVFLQQLDSQTLDGANTPAQTAEKLRQWLRLFPALQALEFDRITDFEELDRLLTLLDVQGGAVQMVLVNGKTRIMSKS